MPAEFTGQHTFASDRGRLTLPAEYRDEFAEGLVITRSPVDRCLWVLTPSQWAVIMQRMREHLNSLKGSQRTVARYMSGNMVKLVPDKQWRVIIPERLREWAGLDGEAVIVGCITKLEIWNSERWAEMDAHFADHPEELAESAEQLGFDIGT